MVFEPLEQKTALSDGSGYSGDWTGYPQWVFEPLPKGDYVTSDLHPAR